MSGLRLEVCVRACLGSVWIFVFGLVWAWFGRCVRACLGLVLILRLGLHGLSFWLGLVWAWFGSCVLGLVWAWFELLVRMGLV